MKKKRKKCVFLSDAQVAEAYFKWQKGTCTVAELADELNITKSILGRKFTKLMNSEKGLRKKQRKILEEYGYKEEKSIPIEEKSHVSIQRAKSILDFVKGAGNKNL